MSWFRRTFEISHGGHRAIPSMEGLRGLAVLLVFLVHYVTLIEPWLAPESLTQHIAGGLRRVGNAGVDLFFVLSGYLIYGALIRKPKPFLPYMRRRIARIYPTFVVVLAIYLALSFLHPAESKLPDGAGAALVYVAQNLALLPGLFDITPIITVAWSLSYELFYYLTIPLVITALGLRAWRPGQRIAFFTGLSVLWFGWSSITDGEHLRLVMFLAGVVLFEALDMGKGKRSDALGPPAFLGAILAMIAVEAQGWNGAWRFVALYVCFFGLCLACFAGNGRTARLCAWTPLRWWGNMSYSYYLIHGLTLKVAFELLARWLPPGADGALIFWLLMPPLLGATLAVSTLLFVWVEKPASLGAEKPFLWVLSGDRAAKGRKAG